MSTYHLQIRAGRRDDAPFMAPLIMAALGIENVNPNHLMVLSNVCAQKNVLYSYHNTLVAEWDGKPVGILISYDGGNYASWREATFAPLQQTAGVDFDQMQDETKEGEWYFDTLSILPEFQGRGIGRALLQFGINRAQENGFTELVLAVDPENLPAIKLYQSLGFADKGELYIFDYPYRKYVL